MIPTQHNLAMVRGDTMSFTLRVSSDYDPESIEAIYFTVKSDRTDPDSKAVLQLSFDHGIEYAGNGVWILRVAPEDTEGAAAGLYYYDIQVNIADDVFTLFDGKIKIRQDTTGRRR